jgi:hypothetical protein
MTMTEHTPTYPTDATPPAVMPLSPPQEAPAALAERLQALQAARTGSATSTKEAEPASKKMTRRPKSSGPAPSRIIAAAASVSAGIGLIALMAGAQQEIVVQVNPTPVTVQPASIVVEMQPASATNGDAPEVQVRVVEPAAPAERAAPQARVVTQSEGS